MAEQANRPNENINVATERRPRWLVSISLSLCIALLLTWYIDWNREDFPASQANAQVRQGNGFDLQTVIVPRAEIRSGGPGKDGIPAISSPKFLSTSDANYLQPSDKVIGVEIDNDARAYPIRILNYHEIVNDRISEQPIAVTYCPLCDSSVVFDRRTPVGEREFGVSGLLFNSNVLLYDRTRGAESLWSQLMTTGISGAAANKSLTMIPFEVTTWQDWSNRNPNTKVLSSETGYRRDYRNSPYGAYFQNQQLMFPVNNRDNRLPPKTPVLAVWTKDQFKAYPLKEFSSENSTLEDTIGGVPISLEFNAESSSLRVVKARKDVQWMYTFWFAWYAFHPDTLLYKSLPN